MSEAIYARVEPAIQAIAYWGIRKWPQADIDRSAFLSITSIAEDVSRAVDSGAQRDDALTDRVNTAIETAINELPSPFRAAAHDHFGFESDNAAGIKVRRGKAAGHFPGSQSEDWYRKTKKVYFSGLTAEDYLPKLVAAVLAGAEQPRAFVAKREGVPQAEDEVSDVEPDAPSEDVIADPPQPAPPRRRRRWPMAAGTVAVAVLVVVAATRDHPRGRPSEATQAATGQPIAARNTMTSSPRYQLAAGLRGVNRSYEKRWGTRIRADVTDRLRFALTLANRAAKQSPELVAWVHLDGDPGIPHGRRVGVVLARPDGSILLRSPPLHIRGWSQDNSPFVFGPDTASISDPSGQLVRKVSLSGSPGTAPRELPALPPGLGPWAIRIGRLAPHQQVVVQVDAMWNSFPPGPEGFGGATPLFRVDTTPKQEWRSSGGVRVGDQVEILLLLDNQSFQERFAHVRVAVQPRRHGQFLRLTLFGTLQGTPEQKIGSATINSSDGRPISLIPQPSSTKLLVPKPGAKGRSDPCYKGGHDSSLDDGITLGGIDIGFFGGYTLHAGCGGTEFNRQIRLRATVIAR